MFSEKISHLWIIESAVIGENNVLDPLFVETLFSDISNTVIFGAIASTDNSISLPLAV